MVMKVFSLYLTKKIIDNATFITISLSNLVYNLADGIKNI